jgi:predicted acylesterase/phospholipase RssA
MTEKMLFKVPDNFTILVPAPPITKIAFRGGGAKGAAYPGAILALEKLGKLQHVDTVAGSSAGSMIAAFVALGFDSAEIERISSEMNFLNFLDLSAINNVADKGICDGKVLYDTFKLIIQNKIKDHIEYLEELVKTENLNEFDKVNTLLRMHKMKKKWSTFADLEYLNELYVKYTGIHVLKDLLITGTNITDRKLAVFSAKTTPKMEIALAIRISTAYPIVFKAVTYEGKQYMDGGAMDNLPVRTLNQYNNSKGFKFLSEPSQRQSTLSFMLGEEQAHNILHHKHQWFPTGILATIKMFLYNTILKINIESNYASVFQALHDDYGLRAIVLPTGKLTTLSFTLSNAERRKLKRSSFETIANYYSLRNEEAVSYHEKDLMSCLLQMERGQKKLGLCNHIANPILAANPDANEETIDQINQYVEESTNQVLDMLTDKKKQAHKLMGKVKNLIAVIAELKELIEDDQLWHKPSFRKMLQMKERQIKIGIKQVQKLYGKYLQITDIATGELSVNPRHKEILNERLHSQQGIFNELLDSLSYYNYTKNPLHKPYAKNQIPLSITLVSTLTHFQLQRKKEEITKVLIESREKYFQRSANVKLIAQVIRGVRAAKSLTALEKEIDKVKKHYKPRTFFSLKSAPAFQTSQKLTTAMETQRYKKTNSRR